MQDKLFKKINICMEFKLKKKFYLKKLLWSRTFKF